MPETGKSFRFIVKQNKETDEIRCFGSTHIDYTPVKILDSYHVRWPVESGIKDLIGNYFLNKPLERPLKKLNYTTTIILSICSSFSIKSLRDSG